MLTLMLVLRAVSSTDIRIGCIAYIDDTLVQQKYKCLLYILLINNNILAAFQTIFIASVIIFPLLNFNKFSNTFLFSV